MEKETEFEKLMRKLKAEQSPRFIFNNGDCGKTCNCDEGNEEFTKEYRCYKPINGLDELKEIEKEEKKLEGKALEAFETTLNNSVKKESTFWETPPNLDNLLELAREEAKERFKENEIWHKRELYEALFKQGAEFIIDKLKELNS